MWPFTRRAHQHSWYANESWARDVGTMMTWDKCDGCPEFRVTYEKPGPGWWASANSVHLLLMERTRNRRRSLTQVLRP